MTWRAAALLGAFLLSSSAQAQAGPRVILLGPDSAREAWTSSLRVELAAEGGQVVYGEAPAGRSARARALDALERAERAHVDAAVWVEPGRRALLHVHVLATESRRTLAAPLATAPDGRTVALVAVSLLDEALAIPEAPLGPRRARLTQTSSMLGNPASPPEPPVQPVRPVVQLTDDERPPVHELEEPAEEWVHAYGALGMGALAFASDVSFDPGALARLLIGMRLGEVLRLQAAIEAGLFSDRIGVNGGSVELQPLGRICPEVAASIPLAGGFSFWIGGHGCLGLAEVRGLVFSSVFDPPFPPESYEEQLTMTAAGGGFIGFDVPLSDSLAFWIRGDVDGHTTVGFINRQPDVLVSVTTMVLIR